MPATHILCLSVQVLTLPLGYRAMECGVIGTQMMSQSHTVHRLASAGARVILCNRTEVLWRRSTVTRTFLRNGPRTLVMLARVQLDIIPAQALLHALSRIVDAHGVPLSACQMDVSQPHLYRTLHLSLCKDAQIYSQEKPVEFYVRMDLPPRRKQSCALPGLLILVLHLVIFSSAPIHLL